MIVSRARWSIWREAKEAEVARELTVGVLSGWVMVMTIEKPELLRRAGVRHLGRIRQAHLDLLMQGVSLIAVGFAVDPLPAWIGILLVLVVLAGFTIGWVALAITAAGRWEHGLEWTARA